MDSTGVPMEAVDAFWNPLHRLLRDLERYAVLPAGNATSGAVPLQSASVHLNPEHAPPVVEMFESDSMIHVTVELPRTGNSSIVVWATPHDLHIRADGRRDDLHVLLPSRIRVESLRATERNGVLDVSIEKDRETQRPQAGKR